MAEAEATRQRYAEQARLAEIAQDQANELLIELLSDEQQRTWIEQHWFEVVGSESGRVYRIRSGNTNNVVRLTEDQSQRERVFCAHPPDIPDADVNLAQMLLLVTDEPAFLAVANSHQASGYAYDHVEGVGYGMNQFIGGTYQNGGVAYQNGVA